MKVSIKPYILNELCEIKKKSFGPLLGAEAGGVFREVLEARTLETALEIAARFVLTTRGASALVDISTTS